MSLTYKETMNQYEALKRTFEYIYSQKVSLRQFIETHKPKSITFVGSGSSYYISQSFEMMAKLRMGIAASSIPAGDLMLHYRKYTKMLENTLLVVVSRSGSTSEIINSIKYIKSELNVPVLSVSCVAGSELSKLSDISIEIPWAFDESVCQTRTVSNMYAAITQVIGYWSDDNTVINDLSTVIEAGDTFLSKNEAGLKSVACMEWKKTVLLADGELQGIATEGSLAFKEISQIPSNCYHLLDSRHGPMVMIDEDTLVIACLTRSDINTQIALVKDIVCKGAKVVVYTDEPIPSIEGVTLHVTSGLSLEHAVQGIPFINLSQLIAYYKAVETGSNPDQPNGLSAWIKL